VLPLLRGTDATTLLTSENPEDGPAAEILASFYVECRDRIVARYGRALVDVSMDELREHGSSDLTAWTSVDGDVFDITGESLYLPP
jgi:hypothetical protein